MHGLYFFTMRFCCGGGFSVQFWHSIGYSGSLVFYDAFLPEIVTEDRYDATSARGYSMGYYGSVLLMVVSLVLIINAPSFGFTGTANEAEPSQQDFRFCWSVCGGLDFR